MVNELPQQKTEISITFLTDPELRAMNRQYLNHDWETDVISFPLSEVGSEEPLIGDIYISYDRAVVQAQEYGVSVENEIHRLAIHGVLHLLGYDHETTAGAEMMRQKEDYYLTIDLPGSS